MPYLHPYLFRRGHNFAFRIAVPVELRVILGQREIVRSLRTFDHQIALPAALELGAAAKRYFYEVRCCLSENDNSKLRELLKGWQHKFEVDQLKEHHADELDHLRRKHVHDLQAVKQAERLAVMEELMQGFKKTGTVTPHLHEKNALAIDPVRSYPRLQVVVDTFIDRYAKRGSPAMLKKHQAVLPVFIEFVGDIAIDQLRQSHVVDFFELVCRLPPRWKDECRKRGVSIQALAELEHDKLLSPKSFDDTYVACIRPFLKASIRDWQDQGFPSTLTTDGIEYLGDREEGEDKQRAFRQPELKRLFEGEEMKALAQDSSRAHEFWLPHIGLFTGARVNEICQLNPRTDVLQDEHGIWYFWISDKTEADVGIVKSVKTKEERAVPIHRQLIDLGILTYIARIKAKGAKRLFPAWEPEKGRASGAAEKWFRRLLVDTNLRDDTPGGKLVGMHAFRHTLLSYGVLHKPPLNLTGITGHAQNPVGAIGAAKGYFDMKLINNLPDLQRNLDQLDYGLSFHKPA